MIHIHFDSEMKKMIMSSIELEWFSSTQYCITEHTAKNIFNIVELIIKCVLYFGLFYILLYLALNEENQR